MRPCPRSLLGFEREFNVSLLADRIESEKNHVPDTMYRDDVGRFTRECLEEGIRMPIQLEPCPVWEGCMAGPSKSSTLLDGTPGGDWRVKEMIKVNEEANEEAKRLEEERRALAQELGNRSRSNLAS